MEGIRGMKQYFYLEESPIYKNKSLIKVNIDELPFPNGFSGSMNVLISRVMNLNYPDYLRYARDRLGAELIGKGQKYVIAYFDDSSEVRLFVKILNKRMEYILKERNSPFEYTLGENNSILRTEFEIK